jgi:transposase InsO family protein
MDIPRSTYYYKPRVDKAKRKEDADIRDRLEELALRFPRYGYRRMTAQLKREEFRVNHKRVLRLMREADLLCRTTRRFVRTTDSDHPYPVYPNVYGDTIITGVDQVWVADITYIRLLSDFVYLAVILDAYSRRVVGWALSRHIDAALTCAALRAAIAERNPSAGCIHHSDRGVQYAADDYIKILEEHKFTISMSRKGNPYDNAQAESFMKTLKVEEVYVSEYRTFTEVKERIGEFIELIYNQERLHSALGYVSPVEFEQGITSAPWHVSISAPTCPA